MTLITISPRARRGRATARRVYRSRSRAGRVHPFLRGGTGLRTANLYYAGQRDLVLLVVDPALLKSELRCELPAETPGSTASRRDERFPHLYGALNLDAVARVVDFPPDAGDMWSHVPPEASR
ncbi:MAG: DUF952 domain-containing protein [Anaerolineae bacterium]|nr:DUF952 domain-containing protein [Anaerolineae bacterium]